MLFFTRPNLASRKANPSTERLGAQSWPEATEESERRRCEQVKPYLEVAKKRGGDKRLRDIYEQSIGEIAQEIHQAVDTVAISDLTRARDIAKCAAEFWLELGSQRYRARLCFPHQATKTLGTKMAGLSGTELIVQPDVRRRGTAQGQRYELEQVVQGCESESHLAEKM